LTCSAAFGLIAILREGVLLQALFAPPQQSDFDLSVQAILLLSEAVVLSQHAALSLLQQAAALSQQAALSLTGAGAGVVSEAYNALASAKAETVRAITSFFMSSFVICKLDRILTPPFKGETGYFLCFLCFLCLW
jgi:hypothetical protein